MSISDLFPAIWKDLPDPRLHGTSSDVSALIELSEHDWRKILGKHLCDSSEPWQDVLAADALRVLSLAPNGPFDQPPLKGATAQVIAGLFDEIRQSLCRPLVVLYDCVRPAGKTFRPGKRWLLVLPSGGVSLVWALRPQNQLKTCYFLGCVGVQQIKERWKRAVRYYVQEFGQFNPQTQQYCLPDVKCHREKEVLGQGDEYRYNFRFVTPTEWGFAGSTPGSPWSPPRSSWMREDG
jgi:hypothetical protein